MKELAILLLFCLSLCLRGQSPGVVTTAGGSNIKGGAALTWTVGQLAAASYLFPAGKAYLSPQGEEILITMTPEPVIPAGMEPRIYPNPAGNYLNVDLGIPSETIAEAELADAAARTVGRYIIGRGISEGRIEIPGLKPGMYFLRITNGNITKVYKVVKL